MKPEIYAKLINNKKISVDIEAEIRFRIKDSVFQPGTVRIHLPAPINASWLKEGQLIDADPFFRMMSVEDFPQRSAYFNEILSKNREFSIKYAFTSVHDYLFCDTGLIDNTPQKQFTKEAVLKYKELSHCGCESYTALPSDRILISDICEDEGIPYREEYYDFLIKNNILQNKDGDCSISGKGTLARKIYETVTDNYTPLSDKTLNLAFVSMCRICGIPARWQGGWSCGSSKDDALVFSGIAHDWCVINLQPYGWIYVDCVNAKNAGTDKIAGTDISYKDFFFGNIDPCMVPTASVPSANLYPAKDYERADKVFNTFGEAELIPGKMSSDGHFEGRGLKSNEFESQILIKVL